MSMNHHTFINRPVPASDTALLIKRLRTVLKQAGVDCECRDSLSVALDRFVALEKHRVRFKGLSEARDHRDRIVNILSFIAELDHITAGESDGTVFEEIALLFIDIADCATAGAAALRTLD